MMLATIAQPANRLSRHKFSRGTPYTISLSIVLIGVSGRALANGWSQAGNIAIGRNNSESISIGVNIVQMMILTARKEGAILPMALPMARKVIMPKNVTPIKAAHEPRTWILKKILPAAS
jgi:hypothetical protein